MTALASLGLMFLLAFAGRGHGAGSTDDSTTNHLDWPTWAREASKAIFGISFAVANYVMWDIVSLAVYACGVTVWGLSTGHGNVYAMDGAKDGVNGSEPEDLEKVFRRFYRGDIHKPAYSWYIMGLKGFFIGLAAFPFGLLLAILWPAAYAWSFKRFNDSAPAEWFSGAAAGIVLSLAYFVGV